jgi:hypothetical protein
MKQSRILFSLVLFTLLISSISAVVIDVDYIDFSKSATITNGQSIDVYVDGGSMHPPTSINVKLNSNSVYYEQISGQDIVRTYTITPSMYSNAVGVYTIEVTATDSTNSDSGAVILTVLPSSNGGGSTPVSNNAPTITSAPVVIVNEGNLYSYQVTASDPEGNSLTYSLSQAPSWLSINSGLISGTAPSVNSNTANNVVVTVSDGTNSVSQTYTLTVLNLIPADSILPVITLIGNSSITMEQGSSYSDAGATATDNIDGTITSRIVTSNPVNPNVLGTYIITYNVQDSSGNNAVQVTRTVNVVDTIKPIVEIIFPEGKTYSSKITNFEINITDANLQSCWYKFNDGENISFSCTLNEIEITSEKGMNTLTVYANDSSGNLNSDLVSFKYKTKSSNGGGSGGSSGSSTVSTIKDSAESIGDIVIPVINVPEKKKDNYLVLYLFMIATTSLGIIILSIILYRRLKEIKTNKNQVRNKIQEQPYY